MRDLATRPLNAAKSLTHRVRKRTVHEVTTDLRDAGHWGSDIGRRGTVLAIEKWLGFWYAFLLAMGLGFAGQTLLTSAQWAANVPALASTVPGLITQFGLFGFLVVLLSGLLLFGIVVVSAVRLLLGARESVSQYWDRQTPPFFSSSSDTVPRPWPPTADEINKARSKALTFGFWGSILFMATTIVLLLLEMHRPTQLRDTATNTQLWSIANIVEPGVWIVDVEGLLQTVMPGASQLQVIYLILLIGVPSILFFISARNLLFATEAFARVKIEKATQGSQLNKHQLWLVVQLLTFSIMAGNLLYQLVLR